MTLPVLLVQRAEDELLGSLMFSHLAREIVREKGLTAEHFSDYFLHGHGNRARYFSAIIDSAIGDVFPAATLMERKQFKPGDGTNLIQLMQIAMPIAPAYEDLIDLIQRAYIERQIARGNLDAVKTLTVKPKFKGVEL